MAAAADDVCKVVLLLSEVWHAGSWLVDGDQCCLAATADDYTMSVRLQAYYRTTYVRLRLEMRRFTLSKNNATVLQDKKGVKVCL